MLAALNIGSVILGVAAGGVTASIVSLALAAGLSLTGAEWGADVGLVIGVVSGLVVGGWVSGWRSIHSHRFHGAVTGLVLAFVLLVIARLGGSPATTPTVLWLAFLSVLISGSAGWLAGRKKRARH